MCVCVCGGGGAFETTVTQIRGVGGKSEIGTPFTQVLLGPTSPRIYFGTLFKIVTLFIINRFDLRDTKHVKDVR